MTAPRAFVTMLAMIALAGCGDEFAKEKAAVSRMLRDPDSAQFRDVQRCGHSDIVEGDVNGNNAFGAKAGFTHFMTDGYAVGLAGDGPIGGLGSTDKFIELSKKCDAAILAAIPGGANNASVEGADNLADKMAADNAAP